MSKGIKNILGISVLFSGFFFFAQCGSETESKTDAALPYLNLSDSAKYVGINTCKLCHQDIYNSFIKTGMGQSFDLATHAKSSAKFDKNSVIYDTIRNFYYHSYWAADSSIKIKEFRLDGKDTVYQRVEKVDYIIGSGQHTNSHIYNTNGYLHQMPMTFYTQKAHWDFPPGFENGSNTRFSRKIGLECMACHNAYPDFVQGSENKFQNVPNGINCERCHGPGSIHVNQKSRGVKVDTSKEIDYSIVNPAKLPIDLQFDVCQSCHLQGNAVLKEGKSFYDFRPGMKLSDVFTVFMPKYEGAEKDFIMASHADRLKMSECFIKTFKPEETKGSLKPYKDALTCVTCHNPHVSVKYTGKEIFNNQCKNCHATNKQLLCSEKQEERNKIQDNCVACHMPKSGSIDIPHVRVTDHFIRKPVSKDEVENVKKFIGLFAINEKNPSAKVKAQAYINQHEKFDMGNPVLLDSALKYLSDKTKEDIKSNFSLLVNLYFLKNDFEKIVYYTEKIGTKDLLVYTLLKKTLSNDDAWTCYRIGEAYSITANMKHVKKMELYAYDFYKQAVSLAPYHDEFQNKLALSLFKQGKKAEAKTIYENVIKQNPKFAPAWANLGYIFFEEGNDDNALKYYNAALALDPDYTNALVNKIHLLIIQKKDAEAKKTLKHYLEVNPSVETFEETYKRLKDYYTVKLFN